MFKPFLTVSAAGFLAIAAFFMCLGATAFGLGVIQGIKKE
jgi:hypothetical protein